MQMENDLLMMQNELFFLVDLCERRRRHTTPTYKLCVSGEIFLKTSLRVEFDNPEQFVFNPS